jgi:TDG/mug DNA glycosylase family protein
MSLVASFAPVSNISATTLVLGSMPGVASIEANQYYAHPRNAFWRIMGELLEFSPDAPYADRLHALETAGIALWDVLRSCHRAGSLDTSIKRDSIEVNDFRRFYSRHPNIRLVCFNGSMAERIYLRHVLPTVENMRLSYLRLPSTSPAHAALSLSQKAEIWRAAINAAIHR